MAGKKSEGDDARGLPTEFVNRIFCWYDLSNFSLVEIVSVVKIPIELLNVGLLPVSIFHSLPAVWCT